MDTSSIQHIVAMPADIPDDGNTYFQGYARQWFPDYVEVLRALQAFPHDVLDIFLDGKEYVLAKLMGSPLDVNLTRVDLIDNGGANLEAPFTVIWSSRATADAVARLLDQFANRPTHITVKEHPTAISLRELNDEANIAIVLKMLENLGEDDVATKILQRARSDPPKQRRAGPLGFVPKGHNCTLPLISVLSAYGYDIPAIDRIEPSATTDPHVRAMIELIAAIDAVRDLARPLPQFRKSDAILYCPSAFSYLYRTDSHHWNELFRRTDRFGRNFIKQAIIRNKGYANTQFRFESAALPDPYKDPVVGPLLFERQLELRITTELIALAATNELAPAVRLPNAVMLHHDRLRDIYQLVNTNRKDRQTQLSAALSSYSRVLKSEIGDDLLVHALRSRERILAVCDFPLEWLSVDLLPMMFRYEMCRVPSTPGNLCAQSVCSGARGAIPLSALSNVLVLRSLKRSDPIYKALEISIDGYAAGGGLDGLTINFVDVSSRQELIDALNGFTGATVIFDCHGNHGGEKEHAWLHIGDEKVDVWKLAHVGRIPPIVMLAACSTHAIDGSHASVANGLMRSGAVTVLGTFAPVAAAHAAIVMGRLLYRLAAFVPLITKHRPISWCEVTSGFLRMSYATDVARDLASTSKITSEQSRQLQVDANTWINEGDPSWFDKFLEGVRVACGLDAAAVATLFQRRFQFVETMLFVQLGRPDTLVVYNDLDDDEEDGSGENTAAE